MSHLGTIIKPPPGLGAADEPRVEVHFEIPSDPAKAAKQKRKLERLTDRMLRIATTPDEDHEDDE